MYHPSKNQACTQHLRGFLPKSRLNLIGAAPGKFFGLEAAEAWQRGGA